MRKGRGMKRLGVGLILAGLLTACEISVVSGGPLSYRPVATNDLRDVEPIATQWLGAGESTSVPVAIPRTGAEGSLLVLMSDSETRISVSQSGEIIASSRKANEFLAEDGAITPVNVPQAVGPTVISRPIEPPDELLYMCNGPCLALDPTLESGTVTFRVINDESARWVNLYAAWIDEGDVTEPDNDQRDEVSLRSNAGDSVYGAIETLGDVDWFVAAVDNEYEITAPKNIRVTVSIYDGGGSSGVACVLDEGETYAFDLFTPIDAGDDVEIKARFQDAASYYGGEYQIRTVASTLAQVPDCDAIP